MSGGILSGHAIRSELLQGRIRISPFDESCINPASIDLRLGSTVKVYAAAAYCSGKPEAGANIFMRSEFFIDSKKQQDVLEYEMTASEGWILKPRILYLMHTLECVWTIHHVPVLDGKSSIGRLGVKVHETAGYGDPGFDGQYTLEVTAVQPVRIYPGMRICQMRFHTMFGTPIDYQKSGHYVGEASQGPVPSMAWKQFVESSNGSR